MANRIPGDVELLWDEFHQVVNMTSDELRTWLLTDASGEDAFPADPDIPVPELGRQVVQLLRKRKVDLTDADRDTMQRVVDFVEDKLEKPPGSGAANSPAGAGCLCGYGATHRRPR